MIGCVKCNSLLKAVLSGRGEVCYYCGGHLAEMTLAPIEVQDDVVPVVNEITLGEVVGDPIYMIDDNDYYDNNTD